MFVVGGVPALLVFLIRRGMSEPARWEARQGPRGQKLTMRHTFLEIFSPRYRLRTLLNLMYQLVSTIGLWAGTVYVPAAITYLAAKADHSSFQAARLASYGTGILSIGTILGALSVPAIADRLGRRANQAIFYSLMFVVIVVTFGYVFYLQANALKWFFVCLFFLGIGGANYTVYSFWLPEQYGNRNRRASALAFAQNVGRLLALAPHFLSEWSTLLPEPWASPVALTASAFAVGLPASSLRSGDEGKASARLVNCDSEDGR